MNPSPRAPRRDPLTWLLLVPIRAYRRFVSPGIAPRCRYAPTCSAYAVEALEVHGPVKGLLLAGWRLLRCNPWSLGGVDHVPPRGRWRPDAWVPPADWAGDDPSIVVPLPMGMQGVAAPTTPATHEGGAALVDDDLPAAAGHPAGAVGVPIP